MSNTPPESDWIGATELQQALGISPSTYYRWLQEGRLQGVKVGRRWRFPRSTVSELLPSTDPTETLRRQDLSRALAMTSERLVTLGLTPEEVSEMREIQDGETLATLLLEHAVRRGASDLHIDPIADGVGVRERVDGFLRPLDPPLPAGASADLVSALKRRAGLEPAAHSPQSGLFMASIDARKIDVRAATYPTNLGESLTLRILDPSRIVRDLDQLGLSADVLARLRRLLRAPKGVILVNGPSGSGKSTTLYTLLRELQRRSALKIMTAEDPVELHVDGLLQASVSGRLGFADALRAMLLHDLDVGMVSELRDSETVQLLFTMAGAGHLMFSALHALDSLAALGRVMELGQVAPRAVTENLVAVLTQRLVPRSCPECRVMRAPSPAELERLRLSPDQGPAQVAENPGCAHCQGTGARGRTVVTELLECTAELGAVIEAGASRRETLEAALPEGFRSLRADMLGLISAGTVQPGHGATVLGL